MYHSLCSTFAQRYTVLYYLEIQWILNGTDPEDNILYTAGRGGGITVILALLLHS